MSGLVSYRYLAKGMAPRQALFVESKNKETRGAGTQEEGSAGQTAQN